MSRHLAAALGAVLTVAACTQPATSSPPPSTSLDVCLVPTVAGVRDGAQNQLTLEGIQAAGAHSVVMQAATPADYGAQLEACVATHPGLIVAVSADMAAAVEIIASRAAQSRFILVDAETLDASGQPSTLSNVASLVFDEKGAAYLVGALAGLMETQKIGAATHNTTGILGLNHSSAVDTYIAGYVGGARAVDPQIQIKLAYSDSADPDFCRQLGLDQVIKGADILFEVSDRCAAGYIDAAYRSGVYGIGSETDRAGLSPAVITSAVKRIDRSVSLVVSEVEHGTFHAGRRQFGLADDGTGFSTPSSVVPQTIIDRVEDIRARIVAGAITPPSSVPPL